MLCIVLCALSILNNSIAGDPQKTVVILPYGQEEPLYDERAVTIVNACNYPITIQFKPKPHRNAPPIGFNLSDDAKVTWNLKGNETNKQAYFRNLTNKTKTEIWNLVRIRIITNQAPTESICFNPVIVQPKQIIIREFFPKKIGTILEE